MKILIVGSGGREHALAWKAAQSPLATEVLVAPGNAGTLHEPRVRNVAVAASDINGLVSVARNEEVGLTIVGPEQPLVAGIVDRFRAQGLRVFGPDAACARLEGSKDFTKAFLARHGIPSAAYRSFTDAAQAEAYLRAHGAPVVAVASGSVVSVTTDRTNGRMVRLRHASGYESYYLHLSAFAPGLRRGTRVSQGAVIGRVGATGLATGPHLHYGLRKNGVYVNPLREHRNMPPGEPVPAEAMEAFIAVRDRSLEELNSALRAMQNRPLELARHDRASLPLQ